MSDRILTEADQRVTECIEQARSFAVVAGAGSGKTTSLVDALTQVRRNRGDELRKQGQQIACLTYTNRAVEVIQKRLGFDKLYNVGTLHGFLWKEISRFQKDIGEALKNDRIPFLIAQAQEKDNGGQSQTAMRARAKVESLEADLAGIEDVGKFVYSDASFSDYAKGRLSHDDIIEISGFLLAERPIFRRLLGARYPYIFVDEAQDTFQPIVSGLNLTCSNEGLPLVGYFGDPWQQIYEGRTGDFTPPEGGLQITKTENFRSSPAVIQFLNAFRQDVEQVPTGPNGAIEGSVKLRLVRAESPAAPRNRYTETQTETALTALDEALEAWGWSDREDVTQLFLVRQMIARRLGFYDLNHLFNGTFSSQRSQDDFAAGNHFLLKPFVEVICPLIAAHTKNDQRASIDMLRSRSPFYSTVGPNASRNLKEMIDQSKIHLERLLNLWENDTLKELLTYCRDENLLNLSERLTQQLDRQPRTEDFDTTQHNEEKGDWLADEFFKMTTSQLRSYCDFINENTPYSTQHGVKGDEFADVLVVYDDVEAGWNLYNFVKLLTPLTAGEPTDGQRERGRKLAYVSFSRAQENLRILLFTPNPEAARDELIESGLLVNEQIEIAE